MMFGVLLGPAASQVELTLVEEDALCSYHATTEANGGAELGKDWTLPDPPASVFSWATGPMGIGYGGEPFDHYDPWLNTLVRHLVHSITASLYIRIPFEGVDADTRAMLQRLVLWARFEDGMVVYLNGVEVLRFNAPEELNSESASTAVHQDAEAMEPIAFDLSPHVDLLRESDNVLAIHLLNSTRGSADLLASVELIASDEPPLYRSSEGVLAITDFDWSEALGRITRVYVRTVRGRVYQLQASYDLVRWRVVPNASTIHERPGGDETSVFSLSVSSADGRYFRLVER